MHELMKNIPFELKELKDTGDFVGMASVYGNVDHGNDVVEPGAFDKSIQEHGAKVRLMDSHKVRIGVATVRSTAQGLEAVGKINTEKQSGAEALSDLKFYQENGFPMGMSIGYQTIEADPAYKTKDGARHLKQVRLWEVTITEMAMNELAQVTGVKSMRELIDSLEAVEEKTAFASDLLRVSEAIDQYKARYLAALPDVLGMDAKAGRALSKVSRAAINDTIRKLQAFLASADPAPEDEAAPAEEAPVEPAAEKSISPTGESAEGEGDDHHPPAEVTSLIDQIRTELHKK